jgi:pimeloyl-ACP methyl ester carboxylesterase
MTARRRPLLVAAMLLVALLAAGYLATGCNVVRWQRDRLVSRMKTAGMAAHVEPLGDATVRYWEGGKGRPVLFIHGFGAEAIWQWCDQVEAFSADHRVIVPDLLWFGGSSSPERDFTLDHQVRTLVALLDKLGEKSVDVVGISYGGLVAFDLAWRHPDRVSRLVIVDSPGCAYTRADYDGMLQRFGTPSAADLLLPKEEGGIDRLMDLAYAHPPWTPGFAKRQVLQEMYSSWPEEKAALLEALVQSMPGRPGCESAPQTPALLIWGRDDPVFPLAIGERLATGLKAKLVIIESARHAPNLEHPAEVNAALRAFLGATP